MRRVVFCALIGALMLGVAVPAFGMHEMTAPNAYAIPTASSNQGDSTGYGGGVFLGLLLGIVGMEADYLKFEDKDIRFLGLASQVQLPVCALGPAGPGNRPLSEPCPLVRPVLSIGSLDGKFGGRFGFDFGFFLFPNSDRKINVFAGMSRWMNVDGLRITSAQIGFGF